MLFLSMNKNVNKGAGVKHSSPCYIDFAAHCASLTLNDIEENIQFEREVKFIYIDYPKLETVEIEPVSDLVGLIAEFIKYFKTWEKEDSYQRCHWVDDYVIEGIVMKDDFAVIEIGS